jgi:DNA-binding MarR family transcriptional regulator
MARRTNKPRAGTQAYFDAEETLGFLLWDTTRSFSREFSKLISRHGVNFGQWPFLRVLWAEDGLTQSALAKRVKMRGPTTVAAVDWLERRGFVRRRRNPEDARKINVFLTAKGRRVYPLVLPEIRHVNEKATRGLKRHELETLKRQLRRLRRNME